MISPGACQIALFFPAVKSSHNVIAVEVMWTSIVDPGKIAAASVAAEAILLTRSISSTSGDSLNSDVDEDVETSRLEVLLSAEDDAAITHPSPRSNDQTCSTPSSPSIAATLSSPAPLRTTRRELALEEPDAKTK